MYVKRPAATDWAVVERRTQAQRREQTRGKLVAAGTELFAAHGYDAVSAEQVAGVAGVTRGALYHHFGGKRELFAAVYESVEQDVVARFPLEEIVGADPLAGLQAGARRFLELSLDERLQRIALLDAPSVLGWERWHEVQVRYGLGLIRAGLQAAAEAGQLREGLHVEELAIALLGVIVEAAMFVSRAGDREAALRRMGDVVDGLLAGLAG